MLDASVRTGLEIGAPEARSLSRVFFGGRGWWGRWLEGEMSLRATWRGSFFSVFRKMLVFCWQRRKL